MKILIVSWYFPPCNTMGALRVGKLSRFLLAEGHDVRVICGRNLPFPQNLPLEIPAERVTYTPWIDVNGLPKRIQRLRARLRPASSRTSPATLSAAVPEAAPAAPASAGGGRPTGVGKLLRQVRRSYQALVNWPDLHVGWFPYALRTGRRLLKEWRADVILASSPPFTGLLVARRLSRRFAIPWVAEYRDRWVEDPYGAATPSWRQRLEPRHENAVTATASGILTVSEPWAADYRVRFPGKPVDVVYNGFDPGDFPLDYPRGTSDPEVLQVVYTGGVYPLRRDPSALFTALRRLGPDARHIRVRFYGSSNSYLDRLIAEHGVGEQVSVEPGVPYQEAIRVQMQADVLLLLQWNDPREQGNCPGKLFEYIAARRPVLGLGYEAGVPAQILRERGAGIVVNDPDVIADKLRQWLAEKRETGAIALLDPGVREGLSRDEQYRKTLAFLHRAADPEAEERP